MSVETAIAIAGGYSPRADKRNAQLTRVNGGAPIKSKVPLQTPIRPGDTINVMERWF
jgi:polysaccharide export outer membrane protein